MSGFFDRMMGRAAPKGSGNRAKERLQFVLLHDRINLPPEQLEAMKQEILNVISKYVSVDSKGVDIALEQRDRNSMLVAEIPFSKRREGVERDDHGDERPSLRIELTTIERSEEDTPSNTGDSTPPDSEKKSE